MKKQRPILFYDIYESLKIPIEGVNWMLANAKSVQRKLNSPEWQTYLKRRLKHEAKNVRRVIRRQLKLFTFLTSHEPTERETRNRR